MTFTENSLSLSTHLLKKDLRRAREKELVAGFLNVSFNNKLSVIDYEVEYDNEDTYLIVTFGIETQRILLSEHELTFGTRTYLTCACGNKTNALYLNNGVFACRKCHGLRYQSTTINRRSKHGQFLYQTSQIIKLMGMRENISRIFYRSQYTKRFARYIVLCARVGLINEVLDARELLTAINSQHQ